MYYLQLEKANVYLLFRYNYKAAECRVVFSLCFVLKRWLPTWKEKLGIMKSLMEILFFTLCYFHFLTTLAKLMSAPSLKLFSV